ncbi:tubulin epsilon and delta complex protein 1-like [Watersipora subatra]|uniref:tubulin epsilon and delta complex protein 1-like n=1 Tax=Watersipora subatra TaxID=2589382 RepID=UPI00355B7713
MAQIKETIELLTRVLRYNGMSKIKSEVFRQAKFDKPEATNSMWKLLFEVIYYLKHRKIEDITIRAYSELSQAEVCMYVKTEMKMRGFVSRSFHELPNDMSEGSRELLLAFGWLMCRSGLVEIFMEQCCTFLDGLSVEGDLDGLTSPRRKAGSAMNSNGEKCDKVAYLIWLNRKLQLSLRNISTLEAQKEKLTHRIHNLTKGVSIDSVIRDHLTVLEVMMLKHPNLLKKNLRLLEADNQRLESLIAWQDHNDNFWKWMESVLDAKLVDSGCIDVVDSTITPRTQAAKDQVDGKLRLGESIKEYEAIVMQLERDLAEASSSHHVKMDVIDAALADINSEISTHLDILLPASNDRTLTPPQEAATTAPERLRLKRERSDTSSMTSVSAAEEQISAVETELARLQGLVERLQSSIDYKQIRYQDDLSSVTSGMESLYEYVTRGPVNFQQ